MSFSLGPGDVSELTPPEAVSQSLLAEMNLPSHLIPSKRGERDGGAGVVTPPRAGKEVLCSKSKQISTPGRISKTHRNPKLPITAPLAAVLLCWPPGVALICSRKPGTMPLRLFHSGKILNFMRALLIIFLKKERN